VRAGALRLRVSPADLRRLPAGEAPEPARSPESGPDLAKALTVPSILELHGLGAEDAVLELDKYLDDATLAGLRRVTVIHGKGTGALRQAVHAHLKGHPQVAAFRLGGEGEGGNGATIVDLGAR